MSSAHIYLDEDASPLKNVDRLWHLQKTGLTEGLSLRDIHMMATSCKDLLLKKNETIYHQGSEATGLYILNRGTVRHTLTTPNGRRKIVGILATGHIFGEEVFVSDGKHQTEALAHDESWISVLERETLLQLIGQLPQFSLNLLQLLDERLMEAREEIETLSFSTTERRIARTLVKLSRKHGKRLLSLEPFKKLKIMMSHEHLAQMIGANRPHVSAIMSDFKKKGLIRYQRRRLLVNEQELARHDGAEVLP
jgi:CRP/FNR family transcriptional regulator